MDHFSYLIDEQHRLLLIGTIVLLMAIAFMLSGTTLERYGRIVYRAEHPKRFWWNVVGWFLVSLFFIGLYLYKKSK